MQAVKLQKIVYLIYSLLSKSLVNFSLYLVSSKSTFLFHTSDGGTKITPEVVNKKPRFALIACAASPLSYLMLNGSMHSMNLKAVRMRMHYKFFTYSNRQKNTQISFALSCKEPRAHPHDIQQIHNAHVQRFSLTRDENVDNERQKQTTTQCYLG